MMKEFPYIKFESTELWNVVSQAITDLVGNTDIEEKTDRKYIVGYLCKVLSEAGIVRIDNDKR